jgi:hypothetical protein
MYQSRFLPLNSTTNTTGYRFLDSTDITDSLAKDFLTATDANIDDWLDLVDGEILSLAQERDVPLQSISIPLHKKILEYCKAYFCFVCFQDRYGRNDITQAGNETLKLKLIWYKDRCETLRLQCTKEMFLYTNLSLQASHRAGGTKSIIRA